MPQWLKRLIDFLIRLFRAPSDTPPDAEEVEETPPEPVILPHYRKTNSLMTFQELKFYRLVLMEEFSDKYIIFSKVRLGDLIWIDNEPKDKWRFKSQIVCKHIDFVLCTKSNLEPVLALELDDSSHQEFDRQDSDTLKDRVCAATGLPLVRVKVEQNYPIPSIVDKIQREIRGRDLTSGKDQDTRL